MRIILLFLLSFMPVLSIAEDIIVLNNGDIIRSKVMEIGQSEIKYKKASNPNGPLYAINRSDIISITYENGETEKFGCPSDEMQTDDKSQDGQIIPPVPDDNNSELINQYNSQYPINPRKEQKNKIVEDGLIYWGFSDESILSTDDLEVRFKRRGGNDKYLYNSWTIPGNELIISIYNKTKSVIYLDLANTFKVSRYNGKDEGSTWYDSTVIGTNSSSDGGATLGLGAISSALGIGGTIGTLAGGIGIGGGKSNGTNLSFQMDRIVAIPPLSEVELPPHKSVEGKDIISSYEDFDIKETKNLKEKFSIGKYELRKFTYNESLFKRDYYISFSKSSSFASYCTLPIHLYVKAIYGYHCPVDLKVKDSNVENPHKIITGAIYMGFKD